ncbi:hypothetical protein DEJ24_11890 [Curtobacterium sp. MCPF17_001]|uniref:hypothetical protein n=1 Tax=Curtobacterium sp. MCPF17_001 TaxID=2175651 RepID=UPI000DA8E789|nr:hypothetical protein [Curtobacterium sp. MCPF17_001]PZE57270.1 hypothetical protein DEJ24_11890 [Curtobacterium sp. MCPF17_001]
MSPSDAQPPLSRRQMRERERAASGGAQPATPPPTVAAPATPEARRRPGSHVAPGSATANQAAPRSAGAATGVSDVPPASATEIVPGTGGMSRRQLRLLREAQQQGGRPVPLQNPTPQSSDRTVQDVLGTLTDPSSVPAPDAQVPPLSTPVEAAAAGIGAQSSPLVPLGFDAPTDERPADDIDDTDAGAGAAAGLGAGAGLGATEVDDADAVQVDGWSDDDAVQSQAAEDDESSHWQDPNPELTHLEPAAVEQATAADGSPDAIEPLEEAAAHGEEPRQHRTTWAPHDADPDAIMAATDDVAAPATELPAAAPGVFPLDLDDDDTNEVPVVVPADAPVSAPTSAAQPGSSPRPTSSDAPREPKPVTTAFQPPAGHWSTFAHDSNDAEVHDEETGTRRVAESHTNALILPNSALADPTGALNATGEVILTGSIDLPSSLSSTGSHRPIDGAEVDRLLEQHDEQPDTDASPVRASRAVSSHTSTRQVVLAAAKPKDSKTPVVLAVAASAVGVVAAGVIVVALVATNFFGS